MSLDGILNIFLTAVIPVAMTVAGVIMTIRQSSSTALRVGEKVFWLFLFVSMGVLSVAAAVWQQHRSEVREAASEQRANDADKKRISDTQYTNGKLDAMAAVLGAISSKPTAGIGDIASALSKLSRSEAKSEQQRRLDTQAKLGELVAEGERLRESCNFKDSATDEFANKFADWQRRSRAAVAAGLDAGYLTFLDGTPSRANSSIFCEGVWSGVSGLRRIMYQEFSAASKKN